MTSKTSQRSSNEDQYNQYMKDVHSYVTDVKADRRHFTQKDVYHPMFSQAHEDGYFKNPPTAQSYRPDDQRGLPAPGWENVPPIHGAPTKSQVWGFHEPTVTAGEAVGPAIQGAGNILSDPRNAWMGTGVAAGMFGWGRGAGRALGGAKTPPAPYRDTGGFSVPTKKMVNDEPFLKATMDTHKSPEKDTGAFQKFGFDKDAADRIANTYIPGPRQSYVNMLEDNAEIGRGAKAGNQSDLNYFQEVTTPERRELINESIKGDDTLAKMRREAMMPQSGGGVPSDAQLKQLKYTRQIYPRQ